MVSRALSAWTPFRSPTDWTSVLLRGPLRYELRLTFLYHNIKFVFCTIVERIVLFRVHESTVSQRQTKAKSWWTGENLTLCFKVIWVYWTHYAKYPCFYNLFWTTWWFSWDFRADKQIYIQRVWSLTNWKAYSWGLSTAKHFSRITQYCHIPN